MFWDVEVLNMTAAINGSAPFVTQETFQQSPNGVPNISLASPWSGTGTAPIPGAYLVENPYRNPYVFQWNFNVQQQLTGSMALTVGYVGSKGTDLMMTYDDNALNPLRRLPNRCARIRSLDRSRCIRRERTRITTRFR